MPIRVPSDVKPIRDSRLTPIRVISTLYDRFVDGESDDSIKNEVKQTMIAKGALFAESDLVIAALRGGGAAASKFLDVRKLHQLYAKEKITLNQFLSAVSVRKNALGFLTNDVIETLYTTGAAGPSAPSLYTEFKPGVNFAPKDLEAAIATLVKRWKIKAA